ncbi:MAG: site-specific integrase [Actinobacteria bacterium]|nr:site-specific integrase [Actinomycetota bacterium]
MAKLTKTSIPGIYRRHVQGCPNVNGKGRCHCKYAVSRRHRGRQRFETYRTFEEARAAKGRQDAGETRPKSKVKFGEYFADWIETYAGRTKRGFGEETRTEYRRSIRDDALPLWESLSMAEIDQAEVRRLYKSMLDAGKSHAAMKKTRGALSPLFNTAIEERLIDFNPVTGVRIPAPPKNVAEDEDEERAKALKRSELAAFLDAVDPDWRLFFEFLTVTGLRIGEAIGLNWKNVVLVGDEPRIRVREQIYKGRRKKYLKSDEGKRDIPLAPAWVDRLTAHRDATYQGDDSPVFASAVGTPLVPGNVYRRVLAPAAIDAGLYVQVGPDVAEVELREVVMRSGRRHLAPVGGDATLCGRRGALAPSTDDLSLPSCAICGTAAEGLSRKGRKAAIAFHAFRHTCASLLFAEGRNVKQVAKWLGHADPAFTLRVYVSLLDEGLGEGLELIPSSDPVGVAAANHTRA